MGKFWRGKILEGENFCRFGKWLEIQQNFLANIYKYNEIQNYHVAAMAGMLKYFKLKQCNEGIDNEGKYFLILLPLTLHKINPPRHIKIEQTAADIALGTCPTTESSFLIATADGS